MTVGVNCPKCGNELGEGVTRCWTSGCDYVIPCNSVEANSSNRTTLIDDLTRHANELYFKRDLEAGKRILIEVGGLITVGGFVLSAITLWLPAVGVTLSTATVARLIFNVGNYYNQSSELERKQIRAAINWIKKGCNLGDQLIGDD